jgi:hypothetical protein
MALTFSGGTRLSISFFAHVSFFCLVSRLSVRVFVSLSAPQDRPHRRILSPTTTVVFVLDLPEEHLRHHQARAALCP